MIDQGIKRAIVIGAVVVVVGKIVGAGYDAFVGEADANMIENQIAIEAHNRRVSAEASRAKNAEIRSAKCERAKKSRECSAARGHRDVETCLFKLHASSCQIEPEIHLCGIVESIEACADPFADQEHNLCNSLRRRAQCKKMPAPDNLDGLWTITKDDGITTGEDW